MTTARHCRRAARAALMAAILTLVAACGGSDDSSESDDANALTFWTLEAEPDRVARTERNLQTFTEQTGIEVELVTIDEASVAQTMITNAASGTLPDVVDHPMVMTSRWATNGLLDANAAEEVVERLDPATFRDAGLEFATVDGQLAAVPTSGWGLVMQYRTDWFEQAGLAPPRTFDDILAAAQALHDPANDRYGIALGNDPANEVTQQIFEHFALGNGCQLIDDGGNLTLTDERCVETFDFYNRLLTQYAPAGTYDSTQQRAVYLAGQAAMILQGPFTLHRLAGLEDAELATCPECADDPAYLARNTGIVSVVEGFHGDASQYGRTSNLGITVDADTEDAQALVEYLLTDGYVEWLAQVPNGMIPMRTGTPEDPDSFVEAWQGLEIGVDRKAPLGEFYAPEIVDELVSGAENFEAWGITQGFGELAGVLYELYTVPKAISDVQNGGLTPAEAAERVQGELGEELEIIQSGG